MAVFPESLFGTKLVYLLPELKSDKQAPEGSLVYPLAGDDYVLTFGAPQGATETPPPEGKAPDQVISARFFDYVPKYVTVCKAGIGGFLSGPFSGCWFIRFFTDGAYHAAHVGTTEKAADSQLVRKAFVDYADNSDKSIFSCFKPNQVWTDPEMAKFGAGMKKPYNLGYIDTEGNGYSIVLVKDELKTLMTRAKVVDHFPKPLGLTKKAKWDPLNVSTHDQTKRDMVVGRSYTVVGARKLESRTWPSVRAELLR